MQPAQWREVLKDKVYALYVYDHHRVAIAQVIDEGWVVTLPDSPETKYPAKTQDDAFKIGRKISVSWLQGALKQLTAAVQAAPQALTPAEVQAEIKSRQRPFKPSKN